jgi:micrococcal nuclease
LPVRVDYEAIVEAAKASNQLTVLCDSGINTWTGGGALIYAGSIFHKSNLWIPDRNSPATQTILRLIEKCYGSQGRNYVYVLGEASLYPLNSQGRPQIVIADVEHLRDFPPGE